MKSAKKYTELLTIIEQSCKGLIQSYQINYLPIDAVSRKMFRHNGNVSIEGLAKESCLCTKQFKRKFLERTGVNPKLYSRIIRFNKAFNLKNRFPQKDWLSIAIECSYYDYQHMVKEYKEFTGFGPIEFHLLESTSPESVLGLTNSLYQDRVKTSF